MRVGTGFLEVLPDFSKFGAAAAAQSGGLQSGMASVGSSMTKSLTLPIAAAAAAGAVMFTGFESSMTKIQSLVGASKQEVVAYGEAVRDLSKSVGKGPRELADALFFITSAGLEGEQALRALEAAAKGSAIGLGETAVVADALTSAMNAYGAENLSAEQATAILVATVREGKVEADQLAGSLGKVIPIASEMGVSFDQVGAAIAAMTRLGLDANVATTGLRAQFSGLLQDSPKVRKGLAKVGLTLDGMRESLKEKGLLATLQTLRERFGENSSALAEVFPNVRALTSVLTLVGNNAEQAEEIFAELANTTVDDLNNSFEIAAETAEFKFGQAMANLQTAMVDIGSVVVPILVDIAGAVGGAATAFSNLPGGVQQTVVVFGLMVAAIGPLLSLGAKLIGLAKGIGAAYTIARVIILEFTGSMTLATAAIPVIGVALIAGLAAWRIWGAAARSASEDAEEFARILSEVAGDVEAAREQFVQGELVKDDDLATLNALGLSLGEFIELLNDPSGFAQFTKLVEETTGALLDHNGGIVTNQEAYIDFYETTGIGLQQLDDLRRKYDENTRSFALWTEQTEIAEEAQRRLNEEKAVEAGFDSVAEQYKEEAMQLAWRTQQKTLATEAAQALVIVTEEEQAAADHAAAAWEAYTQGVADLAAKREQDLDASVGKIIDLFAEELPEALDTSVEKMRANAEEQAALAVRFRDAITTLTEAGAHSLVQELQAQGPIATEQAEELAGNLETAFEIEEDLRTAMGDSLAGLTGPLEDPAMTALMFDIGAEYGINVVAGFNSTAVLALGGVPVGQPTPYDRFVERGGQAEGGRFQAGLYTVGERGPEVAAFDRPGVVLNSQDLARAITDGLSSNEGGGGGVSFAMEINNPTGEPTEASMQNALAAAATVLATTRVFPT